MQTVRVGVVGAGGIANIHLRAMSEVGGFEVVAIADVAADIAKATAATWQIPNVYTDYADLLAHDEIDGVFVCTPTAVHAPPAIAAMEAGKDVFVEKPMEASLDAAAEMVRTARRTGRILQCGLKLRFSPAVITARRIVSEGALGTVYYGEATADRRRATPGGSFVRRDLAGLGATADLGVYALDTAIHVLGNPAPVAVSAVTTDVITKTAGPVMGQWFPPPPTMEVEEFAAAWITFDTGLRLLMRTSWSVHMDSLGGSYFLGDKGGLRLGVGEVRGPDDGLILYRDEFGSMTDVHLLGARSTDLWDLFRREDRAFADAIRERGPSPVDPASVLLTNVVIQGISDSAAAGREVSVRVPDA